MSSFYGPIPTASLLVALPLRLAAGTIFFAHGAQKLFGWFGGGGLEGTTQYMASIGLEPAALSAYAAGGAEFFGGIALLLGLAVRPASLLLAVTMVVAIISVHLPHGLFVRNNGYEFALALLACCISLAISGAGRFSVDHALSR